MALASRFLMNKHTKRPHDTVHVADGSNEHHDQLAKISASWKRMFTPKQDRPNGLWVPTLSGLIKAGDEGVISTALFTQVQGHTGELSLQTLYEAFAKELRSRSVTDRSMYPAELTRFLSSSRRVANGPRRAQSVSHRVTSRGQSDRSAKGQRMSLDLSAVERGLARSMSMKRPTARSELFETERQSSEQISWMRDGQIASSSDAHPSVNVTATELATLSILLGSPLTRTNEIDPPSASRGAFNISIHVSQTEEGRVTLQQHKHSKSHSFVRSYGCSTVAAKHLAAGFLPYRQDRHEIHTVRIDNDSLSPLLAGTPIEFDVSSESKQAQWLNSLPTSRELSLYIAKASIEPQKRSSNLLIEAISTLPYQGGLVPLASLPLIRAVQFVATGGLPPARLLQRLEGLVDKINQYAPHLRIFGPLYEPQNAALLYRERERLGRLATTANVTDSIADKASRMQRYVTSLERLIALVPNMKPQEAQMAVQEATKKGLEQSYSEAVLAHGVATMSASSFVDSHGCPNSDFRSKRGSTQSPPRSGRQSDASMCTVTSPRSSLGTSASSLGKQIEDILKAELPFSVETVATVARLIIAAWTLSVEVVAWEDGESGFRVPDPSELPEKMVLC
ncbi:hypothetical protein IQ06DRAFT_315693 [Phaeosphaeriaceae sp. SRC1lsM3a]|nr:hypothetical protein IQ06DRAFT_315693 [Stagonospora sp. SRC1lsM3a]